MKTFIVLTVLAIIVSFIKGSFTTRDTQSNLNSEIPRLFGRYCNLSLRSRQMVRFCLLENGLETGTELYRNCAQQLKFGHTYEEHDKIFCQPGAKLQSLLLKCFVPAYSTFHRHNPKAIPIVRKCFSNEENSGFHAEDHIKEEYHW